MTVWTSPGSTYSAGVIEIGYGRARCRPRHLSSGSHSWCPGAPGTRPWLNLLPAEVEPSILAAEKPGRVVSSSLWPSRPNDQVHFALTPCSAGGTSLRFTLLTPDQAPDQRKTGHLRRRLDHLLFADLRFSYGQ